MASNVLETLNGHPVIDVHVLTCSEAVSPHFLRVFTDGVRRKWRDVYQDVRIRQCAREVEVDELRIGVAVLVVTGYPRSGGACRYRLPRNRLDMSDTRSTSATSPTK